MSSALRSTCCENRAAAALLFIALALRGCAAPGGSGGAAGPATSQPAALERQRAPILERQRKTYPDLVSGHFISLADFETRGQEQMFRIIGADGAEAGHEQPSLSILRSRNETGAGGLKVPLISAKDQVRFDGQRSSDYALVRDWRPYSLLLFSVYGPTERTPGESPAADGLRIELSIESAAPVAALDAHDRRAARLGPVPDRSRQRGGAGRPGRCARRCVARAEPERPSRFVLRRRDPRGQPQGYRRRHGRGGRHRRRARRGTGRQCERPHRAALRLHARSADLRRRRRALRAGVFRWRHRRVAQWIGAESRRAGRARPLADAAAGRVVAAAWPPLERRASAGLGTGCRGEPAVGRGDAVSCGCRGRLVFL